MSKENNRSWWRGISREKFRDQFLEGERPPWVTHLLLWDALVFVVSVTQFYKEKLN